MSSPGIIAFIIMALATFRIWRLLSEDTILDYPRRWLVRLPYDWREGKRIPPEYRARLGEFIGCPWCLGWWISLVIWLAWLKWPNTVEALCVPLAFSAVVGIVHGRTSDE